MRVANSIPACLPHQPTTTVPSQSCLAPFPSAVTISSSAVTFFASKIRPVLFILFLGAWLMPTQKESLYCPMHVLVPQVQQTPLTKSTQQSTPLRPVQQGGTQPPLKEPRLQPVRQPSPQPTPSYQRTAALLEKISGALLEKNQRVSRLWPTKLCLLDKGFVAWFRRGWDTARGWRNRSKA